MIGLEIVGVSCLVANVAAEAAESAAGVVGVDAADVGGGGGGGGVGVVVVVVDDAAAAAVVVVAVDMVSSNGVVHEDLTYDDILTCHYPGSHFGDGGLRRGARLGALDHMLMKSVAARLEGELISRRQGGNVRCLRDAELYSGYIDSVVVEGSEAPVPNYRLAEGTQVLIEHNRPFVGRSSMRHLPSAPL